MERPQPLSVSQLTSKIKGSLESEFSRVWVRGEVSNFRPAASGHLYFTLKDPDASLSIAWFKRSAMSSPFARKLKDGIEVICSGRISVFPPRGSYQLIVDRLEIVGDGNLQLKFEKLKAQLNQEGLFDPDSKKELPKYPKRIAIVTSPTGAAIRDAISVLNRRFPYLTINVVPSLVQGELAADELIRAVDCVEQYDLGEVILLTRGGGSLEDLWPFNEEKLVRRIFASKIPVVSAVGHEIDFTLSDFVSDLRAPTPSAAAEMITEHWVSVLSDLSQSKRRLIRSIESTMTHSQMSLDQLRGRLISPKQSLENSRLQLSQLREQLVYNMSSKINHSKSSYQTLIGKLDAMSPLKVLGRGYSIVSRNKKIIRSAEEVVAGERLRVKTHQGEFDVDVST